MRIDSKFNLDKMDDMEARFPEGINKASEIDERGMAAGNERGMATGDEEGMAAGDEGGLATNNEHNLKLINRQEVYIDALEIEGKEKCLVIPAICIHLLDIVVEAVESDSSNSEDDNDSCEDYSDIKEGKKENKDTGNVARTQKRHRQDDSTENAQSKIRMEEPWDSISDKHTWSNEEKEALKSFFEKHLRISKVPGKLDCINAQRKHRCLLNISWKKIKFAVYNMLKARKNLLQ
ncbi:uncharacterized protein LOC132730750 isoform X2 [Ruditapes philippinarum]|uniref:uncharacterized protein LOC132730750 isoform X2 n=1 Tax=Ruditapes philippinarum TaxID=129788 RepID=UPI00295A643B|nr:uncharacterized protein LOC132730750 isoform X2 [Ruditapes philippinarum]